MQIEIYFPFSKTNRENKKILHEQYFPVFVRKVK